jgi:hypothetical protein
LAGLEFFGEGGFKAVYKAEIRGRATEYLGQLSGAIENLKRLAEL